jgi:hypothetical protein
MEGVSCVVGWAFLRKVVVDVLQRVEGGRKVVPVAGGSVEGNVVDVAVGDESSRGVAWPSMSGC